MSTKESILHHLSTQLNQRQGQTLWYADENTLPVLAHIKPRKTLQIVTNRFDIYQQLQREQHQVVFSDFNKDEYPFSADFELIVYRISKEKPLVHHLINQAAQYLKPTGTFCLLGQKQEGIKTYGDKLAKIFKAEGKLKKQGNDYIGHFSELDKEAELDDQNYPNLRKVETGRAEPPYFLSKPGVFGWNKIDQGTELLLLSARQHLAKYTRKNIRVLDLACGYGWIFLNIAPLGLNISSLVATDNNAGALLCAKANSALAQHAIEVIASDSADTISTKFDIILCNPPFHQGHQHDTALTDKFLSNAANGLAKQGIALFVTNEFIGFSSLAKRYFSSIECIAHNKGFKVYACHET